MYNPSLSSATDNPKVVSGNDAKGSASVSVGSKSTVTINNDYTTSYTLPATGGAGTAAIQFTGLLLMALAGAGWVLRRRKYA
jgi:LPXTG-motif cell wall-anchored protein